MRRREEWLLAAGAAMVVAAGALFRIWRLDSVPGLSGDEGWWGVQALAWLDGRPYEGRTTSGNPIDLFLLVPLALVHGVASPSVATLRLVPALANLLALIPAFLAARRLYGPAAAWAHMTVLAVLPTAIAHSRICQDPSQTVFWAGLVVYAGLLAVRDPARAWTCAGALLLLGPIALWTHPTNVFLAPFALLPMAVIAGPRLPAAPRARLVLAAAAAALAMAAVIGGALALPRLAASNDVLNRPWLALAAARLVDGGQWIEFAANNVRLLNGVTVYHYFSGARPWTPPYDAAAIVAVGAAAWGLAGALRRERRPVDVALLGACAGTWLLFYAFAGPQALRPHAERWGLCLLVPASLVLARGLTAAIEARPAWRPWPAAVALAAAGVLVASFAGQYFGAFARTGGDSHLTYVTAGTEPKQQALAQVLARAPGSDRLFVVATEWWLYWPIAYLAAERPYVAVVRAWPAGDAPAFAEALARGRVFAVEFSGSPQHAATEQAFAVRTWTAARTTIRDNGGRDLLVILQARPRLGPG
jgi:hypothetical protein